MAVAAMDVERARAVLARARAGLTAQRAMCARVDSWIRPALAAGFKVPAKASAEHRALQDLSRTPWLGLVVTTAAQAMYVSGIVDENGPNRDLLRLWAENDMPAHQIANHRAMLGYGYSFGVVTPAKMNGVDSAKMRCLSPRRMWADWGDAATDPHPLTAVESMGTFDGVPTYRIYDDQRFYVVAGEPEAEMIGDVVHHGLGVVPVVRFQNQPDLEGNSTGEVEPLIPSAARINKTAYDRLLAQHFSSWVVRTISGIDLPEETGDDAADAAAVEQHKLRLTQADLLISEDPETKFGTLGATDLRPFVESWRADIEALAAVSQTPAHALTGQLVNLGADALASARAGLTQKVWERRVGAGVSYSRMIRLAASLAGMDGAAADPMVRVTWQDMEIRSMSQAVDALGKAAQMLGIPKRALWGMIPGVEGHDVAQWARLADSEAEADPVAAMIRRHSSATAEPAGGTAGDVSAVPVAEAG